MSSLNGNNKLELLSHLKKYFEYIQFVYSFNKYLLWSSSVLGTMIIFLILQFFIFNSLIIINI